MKVENTNLSFAVSPEVHQNADNVVEGSVGSLVDEGGSQSGQGHGRQATFEASVKRRSREEGKRPLESEHHDTQHKIYYLQNRDGFHRSI